MCSMLSWHLRELVETCGFPQSTPYGPTLRHLWPKFRAGDPVARTLVYRLGIWLPILISPMPLAIAIPLMYHGIKIDWLSILEGLFVGVLVGVLVGILISVRVGVFGGFHVGSFIGALASLYGAFEVREEFIHLAPYVLLFSFIVFFQLPLYLLEAIWTLLLDTINRLGISPSKLVNTLPFRHHPIFLPLPGLRSLLVALGEKNPDLAQQILAEAAKSPGQKRPARLALAELQALKLEKAGRDRLFAKVEKLDLPFLAGVESRFKPFQKAAKDLQSALDSENQLYQKRALDRAYKILVEAQTRLAARRRLDVTERRLQPTLHLWLDIVQNEQLRLEGKKKDNPQIPVPFITGIPLKPTDPDAQALFKGRRDLLRLIDQDLTSDKREPIVLIGQRRMGKSSLLQMLPERLGTATQVLYLNFQRLSGSEHRATPHRLLLEAVAQAVDEASPPPTDAPWGPALTWLQTVDEALAKDDQRLLLAIDEIEGLQRGLQDGWATPDVLDFFRAAGDQLQQIRLLLATAHPLPRLGPEWVDRLINVVLRRLGRLEDSDAQELILHPVPDVDHTALYPEGEIDRILHQTAGHPYLIQLTCDALCRHLNEERRHHATPQDIDRAFDRVLIESPLFDELWRQRTDDEKNLLRSLALGTGPGEVAQGVRRELEREGYLTQEEDELVVTVPLFARWIAEET